MKQLIEKESLAHFFDPPNLNDTVKGKVIGQERLALFVDLGIFGTGIVFGEEFFRAKKMAKGIKKGETVTAKILELDGENGYIEISIVQAKQEIAWRKLEEMKQKNEAFPVRISKANKGGLMAMAEGIPAFLPVSHLKPEHYPRIEGGDEEKILQKLQEFIGQELEVIVLSLDPDQNSLILSEKEAGAKNIKEILKNYKTGDVVQGKITGTVDFGAFIEFPFPKEENEKTVEGLIHISELDWQLIQHPADIVKEGEIIKAKIIDISNARVSLSLKALKKDPWENLEEKYPKGSLVEGTVIKFNPFGAFIRIDPKIQGLIHVSEFRDEDEIKKVLQIGKKYKFKIFLIEPREHRMILKLVKDENQENTKGN